MEDRPTDRHTDRPTDGQTDRPTDLGIKAPSRSLKFCFFGDFGSWVHGIREKKNFSIWKLFRQITNSMKISRHPFIGQKFFETTGLSSEFQRKN